MKLRLEIYVYPIYQKLPSFHPKAWHDNVNIPISLVKIKCSEQSPQSFNLDRSTYKCGKTIKSLRPS